ncbi:MAG: hypothetical protein CFE24_06255 [Flavobacterium sp. BFFFF2]|nr:MAG: hypothetical protein CFE24_06255 [Flavobacterium sp. BFFFF2]
MKHYFLVTLFITLFFSSCQKTNIQLAKVGSSQLAEVDNYSSIYFNYDSVAHSLAVNDHNRISNTHWLFHIDKRLTMKVLLPTWRALLLKRSKSPHEEGAHEWYFTAFDTIKKKPALIDGSRLTFLETIHVKNALFLSSTGKTYCNDTLINTTAWFENRFLQHEKTVILIDPALSFQQWITHYSGLELLASKYKTTINVQLKMQHK